MLQLNSYPLIAFLIIGLLAFFSTHQAIAQDNEESDHAIVVDIVPPGEAPEHSENLVPGDTLKFQGLPFPLQLLNGAELYLPEEAIVEDIRLEISLPDFTEISETAPQEVGFGRDIANAIEINVYVNDELVSPYKFAEPVELTLPIPENLPEGIGADVSEFVLAYVRDDEDFDPEGISTTVSDTVKGLVSARVEHFSSIAMTSEQIITGAEDDESTIPTHVQLDQNYPNPFNPVTVITYHLPAESNVVLEVYDMLGRKVATLVNDQVPAGEHDVSFDASDLSSGVYIYRLQAGNHTQTRQMTLIK